MYEVPLFIKFPEMFGIILNNIVNFIDKTGKEFIPTDGTLCDIEHIDASGLHPSLKGIEIVTMCDIDNPLYGETGAAYVFGPQKGADEKRYKGSMRDSAASPESSNAICTKTLLSCPARELPAAWATA